MLWKSKRLIWDTRQNITGKDEIVFLRKHLSTAQKEDLKQLANKFGIDELIDENNHSKSFGDIVAEAHQFPDHHLKVIGITGTNGKSTTVAILCFLLKELGYRVLELGTLGSAFHEPASSASINYTETGFTTPDTPILFDILFQAKKLSVDFVVMEVSSHAISLGRIDGLNFDAAGFSNLSQDHLDFHKSMESYQEAKRSLFSHYLEKSKKEKKVGVVNTFGSSGEEFYTPLKSLKVDIVKSSRLQVESWSQSVNGLKLKIKNKPLLTYNMLGLHNVENLLLAVNIIEKLEKREIDFNKIDFKQFSGVPGRLEKIGQGSPYVWVDYAHTPEALERSIQTLKENCLDNSKIGVVFGCGGDRDQTKRPKMADVVSSLADWTVLTNDNPRTEDAMKIAKDISAGFRRGFDFEIELDRKTAIQKALKKMKSDDLLIVAGKGHEEYQIIGGQKRFFSDREVIREVLKKASTS